MKVVLDADDEAIRMARDLVAVARHGALAVIDGETGFPRASRVALATDFDGTPIILVSSLSGHTKPMLNEPRTSLLVGDPAKDDPLAHPRLTLLTRARRIDRETDEGKRIRRRYLARQPKASLYADFGDFAFFRMEIDGASLNGGFGKAYELSAQDMGAKGDAASIAAIEEGAVAHMNEDHGDAISLYARFYAKAAEGTWRIAALDSEGMELVAGDAVRRVWYPAPLESASDLRPALVEMAAEARRIADGKKS